LAIHDTTKLGLIAKGETKAFTLPAAFYDNLNTQIHGMGLFWKDPVKAAAFPEDYSKVVSTGEALRCGEVHVTWEEKL
jgi:hypothetical protein